MEVDDICRDKLIAALNKIKAFEKEDSINDTDDGKSPVKNFKPLVEFCDDFVAKYRKSHPSKFKEADDLICHELHEFNKFCKDFLDLLNRQDELHAIKLQTKLNSQILQYKFALSPAVSNHLINEITTITEKVKGLLGDLNQVTSQEPAKEETSDNSSFFSSRRKVNVACDPFQKKALLCLYRMMERLNELLTPNKKEELVKKLESGVFDVTRLKTLVIKLTEIHRYLLAENSVVKK